MTQPFRVLFLLLPAVALPVLLDSCASSGRVKGVPKRLPAINLHGSPATPSHSMSHSEYPFESNGGYMTAWAAEGERLAGRGPGSDADISSWSASHGGSVSRKQPSRVRKVSSSKSKTGSRGSYTIKKGDTLSAIARKHGTTVSKLKAANGMSSDFIREGKSLKIPR